MSKTNKIVIILIIIIAGLLFYFNWQKNPAENLNSETTEQINQEKITINLSIADISGLPPTLEIKKDTLLLDALIELNQQYPTLNLQTKNYSDMGVLVEQIGNYKNGAENKYWQYFVNGAQPMVGADKYILQNNDQVEWRFSASQF
ncbi:MAG TPA: DUF4430 domain-containing protein [bacterium]|nr:DUF4430 domain-containing protein [bacterium]